ncbi:putative membrane-spanning 4-domains subfamily A member 4A-like [Scophthalmus maximus]|uniref:Putative membrane-spanning 4-domains subfamily A member 4A-like n=1 Tax=Scophthalmus maximus TaxID=52904 RepID=A0A2U9BED2_SCOMX|nr:putative membrane-spanning 4-domains subfamily A member 4A-like [Scophthalmus maximus]
MHGVSGALAVFNLLELIVSITIAGYACSATCNCTQEPPSVVYVPAASAGARDAPSAQEAIGDAIDFCSQVRSNLYAGKLFRHAGQLFRHAGQLFRHLKKPTVLLRNNLTTL